MERSRITMLCVMLCGLSIITTTEANRNQMTVYCHKFITPEPNRAANAFYVVKPLNNTNKFGALGILDVKCTATPDFNSQEVTRCRGFYMGDSMTDFSYVSQYRMEFKLPSGVAGTVCFSGRILLPDWEIPAFGCGGMLSGGHVMATFTTLSGDIQTFNFVFKLALPIMELMPNCLP